METNTEFWKLAARAGSSSEGLAKLRMDLATYTADTFSRAGDELHEVGHALGRDGIQGATDGYGSDEIVAVALLLRIGGQLVSAYVDLFSSNRHYAAAALLRQLVEIEYLARAFQTRDNDAERWLRSSRQERESFFSPRKLREAAEGRFRGKDYGYHCELGGHPVPGSAILLQENLALAQLLIADLLGHTGRIWDHFVMWADANAVAVPIHSRREGMIARYVEWKRKDVLTELPPPP